jgi:hypothetical protein
MLSLLYFLKEEAQEFWSEVKVKGLTINDAICLLIMLFIFSVLGICAVMSWLSPSSQSRPKI